MAAAVRGLAQTPCWGVCVFPTVAGAKTQRLKSVSAPTTQICQSRPRMAVTVRIAAGWPHINNRYAPPGLGRASPHEHSIACFKKRSYTTRMPSSVTVPEGQLSRRDKFRAYMQAFNPTAPAHDVIQAGLVFEDLHQSLYRNLAGRADLEPGSQQLLVGGVGSGKTTELLLARRWLAGQDHVLSIYIDVSAITDLSSLNAGALLAGFGIHLGSWIRRDVEARLGAERYGGKTGADITKITEFAYGKQESPTLDPPRELPSITHLQRSHWAAKARKCPGQAETTVSST